MKRVVLMFVLVAGLGTAPVMAATLQDALLAQLEEQGYSSIKVSRTFLGRMRILAVQGDTLREIVVNPNTGEILRDYQSPAPEGQQHDLAGRSGTATTSTEASTVGTASAVSVPDLSTAVRAGDTAATAADGSDTAATAADGSVGATGAQE